MFAKLTKSVFLMLAIMGTLLPSISAFAAPAGQQLYNDNILSDGQFVYGPNIGDFKVGHFLADNAPHLSAYAEDLYQRAEYYSINPKVYLTLLEIHSQLITTPDSARLEDPFGLNADGLISQIELLSDTMSQAYYLHLYKYSNLPVSERKLKSFVTPGGIEVQADPETNAATYAIIAGLASLDEPDLSAILDNSQPNGFYQTYRRLFDNDDPLDESNAITIPGELSTLAAPDGYLQLPFLRGLSWKFGGVHDTTGGGGVGSPFNDASSLDFYPGGINWGADTSNMWIVASAAGVPTRLSNCGYRITHADGWETTYYHLENTQFISGSINQNDKIGVIANTEAEATCTGGAASGPHVHFSLKHNGAYVAINGTSLSGWVVNCNAANNCLTNYDTDPTHMWLERNGVKKYPFNSSVLSEAPPITVPYVISSLLDKSYIDPATIKFNVAFSESVSGVDAADFLLTTVGIPDAAINSVSGSGSSYGVIVNKGSGQGTIRLDVVDDDTIIDIDGNPLNSSFSSGDVYSTYTTLTLNSIGAYDGSVLESTETSSQGGTLDSIATTFKVGDDAADRQYRGFLHFNTAPIPDAAFIVSVTLKIKKQGLVGTNAFATHGLLWVDMRAPLFGSTALTLGDFKAGASKSAAASFGSTSVSNWYSASLAPANYTYINKIGATQFRLRFAKGDNDDGSADYLRFYSGNSSASTRPQLVIQYYIP